MTYDLDAVRREFPALSVTDDGRSRVYLDAPGGTQVCRRAIDRMVAHLAGGTANDGGLFRTSIETDALSEEAHAAVADLVGGKRSEIAFGPNMTTLMFAWSRALARGWGPGGALVLTRMDHDANVAPWLHVARDFGMEVRWLDFDPATYRFRLDELPGLLDASVRLVAVSHASNALGTLNPVADIAAIVRTHAPQALVHVDSVQAAPHVVIDVAALGCDSLVFSPYKLFGPHQGVLWAREALFAGLDAYKVRPSPSDPPAAKLETGTPSWEGQAGTLGAIEHLEWIGRTMAGANGDRRSALVAGMELLAGHEAALGARFLAGLAAIPGIRLHGVPTMADRVPTFAFTLDRMPSRDVAQALADANVFVWSGSFYAVEVVARLGLTDGGLVRIGPCHYNSAADIDAALAVLEQLARD
jgi:cysteine desulfurase family protein (TIGR01976 family)